MCTEYLNNMLCHQHIYHILLAINLLHWFNQRLAKTDNLFSNMLVHKCQPLYKLLLVYQLIYPEVLITNHQMEDNLEIHLEEVHL